MVKGKEMTNEQAEKCPKYQNCDAPLCPLDLDKEASWYIDEEVCKSPEFRDKPWIMLQRKLKGKRTKDPDHLYTYKELIDECRKAKRKKK